MVLPKDYEDLIAHVIETVEKSAGVTLGAKSVLLGKINGSRME